jgi:membrane protein YqaA with SNARE-associated domain
MLLHYGLYLTTYIVAVISGVVPVVNIEIYLIWVAALTPRSLGIPITILATVGQMTGKTIMYLAAAGILKISVKEPGEKLAAIKKKFESWKDRLSLFMFLSAFSGFPPFYVVSLAAGGLRVNYWRFLIAGLAGRLLRFALVVFFPYLIKGLIT